MKIAAAAFPIEWQSRWNDYVGKLRVWVRTAVENGADLLVFPEYAALELSSLAGEEAATDLQRSIDAVSARIGDVDELHASLAREFEVHISAATAPVRGIDRITVNRARLFAPDGSRGVQDKLIMTRYEREEWGISPGDTVRVFETALGRIGILVGYNCQFPLIARAMAEAGAEILLVPSWAETTQGYWRVRVGAMARALENQCVVVHAPTVGDVDWSPPVATNVGAAAIYGPPDFGFPEDGILAIGKMNAPGWVYADIPSDAIRAVRSEGRVLNFRHWPEQDARLQAVELRTLGQVAATGSSKAP